MPGSRDRGETNGGSAGGKTRAILVDDQLVFRLGLRFFLSHAVPEIVILGEGDSAAEGLRLADRVRPDLALLDASLPDSSAEELVAELRQMVPHCRLMVLANIPDTATLAPALAAGADGCVLKTVAPEQLVTALREVIGGKAWVQPELSERFSRDRARVLAQREHSFKEGRPLTRRELEVIRLIAGGLSNAEIGHQLHISEQTVKTHIAHLMRKIEVRSRLQAARYAIRRGLVQI